jgi:hypothetical protein
MSRGVPYEAIDPLVRGIVRVLNEEWGVRTAWSCSGHGPMEDAYISFTVESHDTIRELLAALPFSGWRSGFVDSRPVAKVVWTTVCLADDGALRYDLRMSGYPEYMRKELIGEVEAALTKAAPARKGRGSEGSSEPRLVATG